MHRDAGHRLHAAPVVWADIVARQAAVLRRDQLAARGVGRDRIRAACTARRWQAVGRDVVVLHNGVLSERQRRWAAVLMLDKPAALAGLTAAAEAGLTGFDDPTVHLVVAGSSSADAPPWVRVHNSRRFGPADVAGAGIPRTGLARSLIDAAAWSPRPRRACAIVCAGVQQRLMTAAELERALVRAGRVRHVALLRGVLGDIGGGGHTLAELDLAPLARRAGLPPPRRQQLRRDAAGRVRWVDAVFELPDGTTLVVEIDGSVHLFPATWWADMSRQNEIVIGGEPVLRFDSVTMRIEPDRIVDQLARFGRQHGCR